VSKCKEAARCILDAHKGASHQDADGLLFGGDEWETPDELFACLETACLSLTGSTFGIDVCASAVNQKVPLGEATNGYWAIAEDSLSKDAEEWRDAGPCWMNPPYSNPAPWLEKAHAVQDAGGIVFALIPAALETRYFRDHVTGVADTILILSRRIRFVGATASAKGPNVVAIYRPHLGDTRWVPFDITPQEAGSGRRGK